MLFLFVVLAILLGLAIVITIAFPFVYQFYYHRRYHHIYGRKLYRIAMVNDYYLINQLLLKKGRDGVLQIDHLMFGNKYIYLFYDFYCDKDVYGKSSDNSFLVKGKNENSYVDNPLLKAKQQIIELASLINFDESLFVPIAILNNSCSIKNEHPNSLVFVRKLKQTIKFYESQDVDPLNQEQMYFAVKDIARINLRDKKR